MGRSTLISSRGVASPHQNMMKKLLVWGLFCVAVFALAGADESEENALKIAVQGLSEQAESPLGRVLRDAGKGKKKKNMKKKKGKKQKKSKSKKNKKNKARRNKKKSKKAKKNLKKKKGNRKRKNGKGKSSRRAKGKVK